MTRLAHSSLFLALTLLGACAGQTSGDSKGRGDGANRGGTSGSSAGTAGQGASSGHAGAAGEAGGMLAIWRADNSSDWESGVGGTGEGGGCGSGSYWDDEFANGATGGTGAGTAAAGGSGGFGTGGTGGSIDYGTGGAGYTPSTAGSSGGPPVPGAGGTGSGTGGGSAGGGQAGAPSGGGSAGHGTGGSSWEFPEDPENQVRITWGNSARTCSESWNDGCGNANAELTISRDQLHPGVIIDLEQTNAFMSASGVNLDGTGPDDCWFGGGTLWGTLEVLEVTEGTLRFRVEGTNWEEPSLDGDFTAYWCN